MIKKKRKQNPLAMRPEPLCAFAIAVALSAGIVPANANDGEPGMAAASTATTRAEENWFESKFRTFRTYPHLDRAYRLMDQNRLADAKAELEQYLAIDPRDDNVRITYVILLHRMKDFGAVVSQSEIVLRAQPNRAVARIYRGLALQSLNRLNEAFADFQKVASDPQASKENRVFAARSAYATALKRGAQNDQLTALDQLATMAPDFDIHMRRGDLLAALGRAAEAEAAYHDALNLDAAANAQRARVYRALGELAKKSGDLAAERKNLALALELDARNPALMRELADAAYLAKDYPQAIAWMRQYLAVATPKAADHEFLANLLIAQKDDNGALVELTRAVELSTKKEDLSRLYLNLGQLYARIGKYPQAAAAFRHANQAVETPQARNSLEQTRLLEHKEQTELTLRKLQQTMQQSPSSGAALQLGRYYAKLGYDDLALPYLEQASRDSTASDLHLDLYKRYAARNDSKNAMRHLEIAARNHAPELEWKLGTIYAASGDTAKAIEHLEQAVRQPLSAEHRRTADQQLGYLYGAQHKLQQEAAAFRNAIDAGLGGAQIHLDLGQTLFQLGLWNEARQQFSAALEIQRTPLALVYIARSYDELKQPGLATEYLRLALEQIDRLPAPERKSLYDELGYLYMQQKQYPEAEAAWKQSLALQDDPVITLRVGIAQSLQNRPADALATEQSIPAGKLPQELEAAREDELALDYQKTGQQEPAMAALLRANALQPSTERAYRIGAAYLANNQADAALPYLEQAYQQQPASHQYAESLIYAYNRKGRYTDATRLFEQTLADDPEHAGMRQDIAYAYLHSDDSVNAERWFKQAIDYRYSTIVEQPGTMDEDLYRLRSELGNLNKTFEVGLYQSYRANNHAANTSFSPSPGSINGGLIPSQGGLEALYKLPGAGVNGDWTWQLFSRMLWSNEPGSVAILGKSLQGGLGARVKPFSTLDFYVGLERLVKIGNQAQDDWLLRSSIGWSDGYGLKPNQASWNMTTVYGDFGYFFRNGGTESVYGEARQGRTFNVANKLLITPHLVIDGRHQWPDPFDTSYFEGGVGVSFKYLFNETRYEATRSNIDFNIQYKHGISPRRGDGWVFTLGARF
ncbi:NfrA family protein [Paraherbaspirillum soli]|uniref:Tetratricopeptide repeat protein n=1 Tax=Paraherbaspirillum soli TaxID=631222 RepID=A0ABW0M3L3_9BURK